MPPTENEDSLEFAEELNPADDSGPVEAVGDGSGEIGYASEVNDVSDEYEPEPTESRDLSGFADDAGEEASYVFDATVPAFEGNEGEVDLTEDSNLQDSGEFTAPADIGADDDTGYTDEAETIMDSGAFAAVTPLNDTPAEGYAEGDYAEGEAYAEAGAEGEYAEGEAYAEGEYAEGEAYAEAGAEGEYAEGEAYAEGEYAEGEAYAEAEPEQFAAGAEADAYAQGDYAEQGYADDTEDRPNRPGQIGRSALDDIFDRAKDIKKDS